MLTRLTLPFLPSTAPNREELDDQRVDYFRFFRQKEVSEALRANHPGARAQVFQNFRCVPLS